MGMGLAATLMRRRAGGAARRRVGGQARPHGMADRRHCSEARVRWGRHFVRRNASPGGRLVFGEV